MFERVMASFISSSMASMTITVSLFGWSWEEGVSLTSITCSIYFLLFFGISFPLLLLFGSIIMTFAKKTNECKNASKANCNQINLVAYLICGVILVFLIWSGIVALDWIDWITIEISKDLLFVVTFGMVETTLMFYFVAVLAVQLLRFAHDTPSSVYRVDREAKEQ